MSGPFMPEWLQQLLVAPADATSIRKAGLNLPEIPKIGPLAARNDPRHAYHPGKLDSPAAQVALDFVPGLGAARGVHAARDYYREGGSLPLALGMAGLSALPEGAAAAKLGGKGLSKLMRVLGEEGGATLHATGDAFKGTGFMVADPAFTVKVKSQAEMAAFLGRKDVREALGKGKLIGKWTDPATHETEINLSDHFFKEHEAQQWAHKRGEKAIGHIDAGEYKGDIPTLAPKAGSPPPSAVHPMTGEPLTVADRPLGTRAPEHQARVDAGITAPKPGPKPKPTVPSESDITSLTERIARKKQQLGTANGEYADMLQQDIKIMADRLARLKGHGPASESAALGAWDKASDPITQAAMRDKNTGQHWSGTIHDDARAEAALDTKGQADLERGFSTQSGRFLTEKEAGITNSKQIRPDVVADSVVSRGVKQLELGHLPSTGRTLPLDVSINPEGVDASRPALYRPKKADLSVLDAVKRRVKSVYTPAAERGLRDNPIGSAWYDMSPLQRAFIDESPTGRQDFKMFMDLMGPTSAGTDVPQNMRQASFWYQQWKQGKLTPEALLNRGVEIPKGFANRLRIAESLEKVLFKDGLNPISTPKTFRYSGQLGGTSWGGTALDRHVGRNVGLEGIMEGGKSSTAGPARAFPDAGYAKSGKVSSSPDNNHYAAIEDAMVSEAGKLGVHPAAYQAAGWVGNAAKTGVTDARHPLEILNQKLGETASRYGYKSGSDALRAFIRGETPLWALGGVTAGAGLMGSDEPQ